MPVRGYEIHMGETSGENGAPAFATIRRSDGNDVDDGARSADGRVNGTYLHGIFDGDAFRHAFIQAARAARGLSPAKTLAPLESQREIRIDRVAAHVRAAIDIPRLLGPLAPDIAAGRMARREREPIR